MPDPAAQDDLADLPTLGRGAVWATACALLGYGRILVDGSRAATPHSDFVAYDASAKYALWDSLRHSWGVPFWESYQLGGAPSLSNISTQLLNWSHLPFLLTSPAHALGPTLWILMWLAGLSGWLWGRALGCRVAGCRVVAAAWLFAPKLILVVYAGWLSNLPNLVALPLLAAAVVTGLERPSAASIVYLAVAGALSLSGSMVQVVLYAAALMLPAVVFRAVRGRSLRSTVVLAAGSLLAVGLVSYQLIPFLAERGLYVRDQISYAQFLSGHGSPDALWTLLWPDALGTPLRTPNLELWEDSAHFGFATTVLALVGMVAARRRPWARYLSGAVVVTLLCSFDSPWLRGIYEALPGLDKFRLAGRVLFVTAMLVAGLAGLGLEALQTRRPGRPWAVVAVALIALQGMLDVHRYLGTPHPELLDPHLEGIAALGGSDHRVATVDRSTLNAGWAAQVGVQLIGGYDPLSLRDYQRYWKLMSRNDPKPPRYHGNWTELRSVARWDLLDALGVRNVVMPEEAAPWPNLVRQGTLPQQEELKFYYGLERHDLAVYRNPTELPRARWVESTRYVAGDDQAALLLSEVNARHVAVIEGAAQDVDAAPPGEDESVTITDWHPGRLTVSARAVRPRYLVVSEIWHPGWTASVDGVPQPLQRVDVALMGLSLPAGSHQVELRFTPLLWGWARAVTALALLITLAMAGGCYIRRLAGSR